MQLSTKCNQTKKQPTYIIVSFIFQFKVLMGNLAVGVPFSLGSMLLGFYAYLNRDWKSLTWMLYIPTAGSF